MPYNVKRNGHRCRTTCNDLSLGRRLRVGHRLLVPAVGVRLLPPQIREQGIGNREQGIGYRLQNRKRRPGDLVIRRT